MDIQSVIDQIAELPVDWHAAGSVRRCVFEAIARHVGQGIAHSMETGTGKTTLLFSHLSANHRVFVVDDGTLSVVRQSPLLNRVSVEFVIGPSQRTLSGYSFPRKLEAVLLDGPHGYPAPDLEYYHVYPHLAENALLIVDDIHIPTIHNLFEFLKEEEMFRLLDVVDHTAFFRRTDAPVRDPFGGGWEDQGYNTKHFPVGNWGTKLVHQLKKKLPRPMKARIKKIVGRV